MKLNLADAANKKSPEPLSLTLEDRLPLSYEAPCLLQVAYTIEKVDDFYVLMMQTEGSINLLCDRCGGAFASAYKNDLTLAVCANDDRADTLSAAYECIVSSAFSIDLIDVVTDELHLYGPRMHSDNACVGLRTGQALE